MPNLKIFSVDLNYRKLRITLVKLFISIGDHPGTQVVGITAQNDTSQHNIYLHLSKYSIENVFVAPFNLHQKAAKLSLKNTYGEKNYTHPIKT